MMHHLAAFFEIAPAAPLPAVDLTSSAINAVIFLVALALLGVVAVRLMRSRRGIQTNSSLHDQIEVCSTRVLSARSRLVTVKFNQQVLLLGVTEHSISTLASHPDVTPAPNSDPKAQQ